MPITRETTKYFIVSRFVPIFETFDMFKIVVREYIIFLIPYY